MSVLTGMQCQCFICKHPSGSKCDSQLWVEWKRRESEYKSGKAFLLLKQERDQLADRVNTLEDALTKIAGYFDVPDWVKRKALEALAAKETK